MCPFPRPEEGSSRDPAGIRIILSLACHCGKMSVRDHFRVKKLVSAHGFWRCRFIVSGRQGREAPRKEDLLGPCWWAFERQSSGSWGRSSGGRGSAWVWVLSPGVENCEWWDTRVTTALWRQSEADQRVRVILSYVVWCLSLALSYTHTDREAEG